MHIATGHKEMDAAGWFRDLVEGVGLPVILLGVRGDVMFCNQALLDLTGWRREDLTGQSWVDVSVPVEDRDRVRLGLLESVSRGVAPPHHEARVATRAGASRLLRWHNTILRGADGTVAGIASIATDAAIRTRAEVEQTRRASQLERDCRRLETIVDGVPGIVWEGWREPDTTAQRLDFVSGQVEPLLGYSPADWLATPDFWLTIVHPDDRERAGRERAAIVAGGEGGSHRFRWVAKDGRTIWSEARIAVIRDEGGRSIGTRGLALDVGEWVRSVEALRESEGRHRSVVDSQTELVCRYLPDTTLTFANEAFCRYFGKPRAELLGESFLPLAPESERETVRRNVETVLRHRAAATYEHEISLPDGTSGWQQWTHFPAIVPDGDVVDVQAIARDVTEHRRAVETVRAREARLRTVLENARDIVFRYRLRPEPGFEYVSLSATTMTGYTPEEHYADPDLGRKMVHPDDLSLLEASLQSPAASDAPVILRWRRKDGSILWTEQRNVAVLDEAGRLVAIEGIARDITERKASEARLRQSEEYFRLSFDLAPVGAAMVGLDGRYLRVNDALCRITGRTQDELLGHTFADITHPDDLPGNLALLPALIAGEIPEYVTEKRYLHKDGTVVWVQLSSRLLRDADGRPDYLLATMVDITGRKAAEAALRELNTRLEARVIERTAQLSEAVGRLERAEGELRRFNRRLVQVEEDQRAAIARELHDEIGQELTGLNLTLEVGAQGDAAVAQRQIREAQTLVNNLNARVRRLSLDLRPPMLDDLGLLATLDWHVRRFTAQTQIQVTIQHAGREPTLTPEVAITAYRVAQEALTNVARHAAVSSAVLRLWATDEALYVQVSDSGRGFDAVAALADPGSSGLVGMRERVRLLGGTLTIDSVPGVGTQITADLPLA